MWAAVNKCRNSSHDSNESVLLHNPDVINSYFARIASKEHYDCTELDCFRNECTVDHCQPLTYIEVERLFRNSKLTAAGCDDIPASLLHTCSYELADVVAHILNCCVTVPSLQLEFLATGSVLSSLLSVPKVSTSVKFSYCRPISVTPHLSRIAKKIFV